jgi:peptidoglycan/xylan/chitin deacetylase (PgdA/CDA1 family)
VSRVRAKRALALPSIVLRGARTVPRRWILTLHAVGSHRWAYPEAAFDDLVGWLRAETEPVPLPRLLAARPGARPATHLTFDDGYAVVGDLAEGALRRRAVPTTVFLPTALLSEEDATPPGVHGLYDGLPLLGWRRVRALAKDPLVAFGSHGATHRALESLPAAARAEELSASRRALAEATGAAPDFVAYPFGRHDDAVAAAARDAGYAGGLTTRHGGVGSRPDPFRLPRVDVRPDYTVSDLRRIVRGEWDFLALSGAARRRRP